MVSGAWEGAGHLREALLSGHAILVPEEPSWEVLPG